jgi:hypothetical protein
MMTAGDVRRKDLVARTQESDATIKLALDRIRRVMKRIQTERGQATEKDQ